MGHEVYCSVLVIVWGYVEREQKMPSVVKEFPQTAFVLNALGTGLRSAVASVLNPHADPVSLEIKH